jgi:hypothetical protein
MDKKSEKKKINQTVSCNIPEHQTVPTRKTTCHHFFVFGIKFQFGI